MMVLLYTLMFLAYLMAWFHYVRTAITCFILAFLLAIGWFLFHIYDPQYGFRMPWIQTEYQMDKETRIVYDNHHK